MKSHLPYLIFNELMNEIHLFFMLKSGELEVNESIDAINTRWNHWNAYSLIISDQEE
jgi:hypothetical protein